MNRLIYVMGGGLFKELIHAILAHIMSCYGVGPGSNPWLPKLVLHLFKIELACFIFGGSMYYFGMLYQFRYMGLLFGHLALWAEWV